MTAAAVMLSPPAAEVTQELVEAALTAFGQPAAARYAEIDALARFGHEPVDEPARRWAERIATADAFPLFGTGLSASTYPALLWNGARLDAIVPDVHWAPLLAALAAADPADVSGLERVARALAAAETVRQGAAGLLSADALPVAWPTLSTMAAATAAHLGSGCGGDGLARVLDLAVSLTALTPGETRSAASGLWAGHGAASGWLAARLPSEAVTPMAGSVAHTLSAAAGHRADSERKHGVSVADVLTRLR